MCCVAPLSPAGRKLRQEPYCGLVIAARTQNEHLSQKAQVNK